MVKPKSSVSPLKKNPPKSLCYIGAPFVNIRKTPDKLSEIVTQGSYGETVQILEDRDPWVLLQMDIDAQKGWALKEAFLTRDAPYVPNAFTSQNACHVYSAQDTIYGPILTLPYDTALQVLSMEEGKRWVCVELLDYRKAFIQKGDLETNKKLLTPEQIGAFSQQFLGLPYTWGGRTSFGYDCSGFVQMLYRQRGIFLPRDAKDQILDPRFCPLELSQLSPCDLLFWGKSETEIKHVALYLGNDLFIHATVADHLPHLRISSLTDPYWRGNDPWPYVAARGLRPR